MKKFLNLILVVVFGAIVGIGALVLTRFLTQRTPTGPSELSKKQIALESEKKLPEKATSTEQPSVKTEKGTPNNLPSEIKVKMKDVFETEVSNLFFDYPNIKTLFIREGEIKEINLKEKTYRELFVDPNLSYVSFSPNGTKAIIRFQNDPRYFILDFGEDRMSPLPAFTENFAFLNENKILLYRNNQSNLSELALWQNFNISSLKSLGVLNPEIVRLDDNRVLLYEKPISTLKTPVFLYDIRKPEEIKIVLPPKFSYSIIASDDGQYVFVNYQEFGEWRSELYNDKFQKLDSFFWGTIKEKCTFKNLLVCGVPIQNILMTSWYQMETNSQDKVIVINPETKELKEIFKPDLDILQPYLTDIGLFFLNRINHKLFFVETKYLSLQ